MKTPRNIHPKVDLVPVIMAISLMTVSIVHASYESYVLANNPLAFYPLTPTVDPTGTSATDLSGNGNNGTYVNTSPQYNAVSGPSALIPNALQFDGVSDFVDLSTGTNTSILNFSGPITMEAWVQPANSTSFGDILAKGYDSSTYDEISMRVNGPYGANYYATSGSQAVSGGQQNNNWTHVVLANDGATTTLYINGTVAQSTPDTTGAITFSDPWAIGNGTSAGNSRYFNGNICEVALYNHGLSPDAIFAHYFYGTYGVVPSNSIPIITNQPVSQVSFTNGTAVFSVGILDIVPMTNQWYRNGSPIAGQTNKILILTNLQPSDAASYSVMSGNANGSTNSVSVNLALASISAYEKTVVSDGPLAYYPLDDSIDSSPMAEDLSGNGNFGYYVNTDPVGNSVAGPSAYIPHGVNFSSALVDLSRGIQPSLLNFSGPISMEAWVQPADSTSFGDIMAKGYDGNTYQETVIRENGAGNGNNYYASSGSAGVSGGQQNPVWTHIVLSSDGARCNLYVNGVLVQSVSDTVGSQIYSDPWAIGDGTGAGNSRYFNGAISQVAIYNHGLSTNQVLQHYFMGSFGVAPSNSIPIISAQPQPQSAFGGSSATFSFGVVGTLPTTNLWLKNGSPLAGQTNSTLVLNNVQTGDAANYSVVIGNSVGTTNSGAASLTVVAAGDSLLWTVTNNTGIWDSGSSANWVNVSNSQQVVFNTGDKVLFDDTPGVPTSVSINGTVAPVSITVNSTNNTFSINGPGSLVGGGSLLKEGPSVLTMDPPSGFSGPVTIAGGSIYAGNNSFGAVASVTITNNSTLDFGGGNYNTGQPITISGTGVNAQGALFNSYGDYPVEVYNITLAGDTTFGGSQRWDLGSGSSITGAHNLIIDWSAGAGYGEWNTVTIGANVTSITLTNGSKIGLKYMDTSFQNPGTVVTVDPSGQALIYNGGNNGSFHIESGALFAVYSDGVLGGNSLVFEDGTEWDDYGGGSSDEPISNAITLNGFTRIVIGNHNMVFANPISGAGGFVSDAYDHSFVFSVSNTYAGPSAIGTQVTLTGNGSISHSTPIFFGGSSSTTVRMDVTGRSDHTLTLASGQTLAGVGEINGSLVVSPGATVSPAGTNTTMGYTIGSNPTGTITVTTNLTLSGTTIIKLNGTGVNDVLQANGSITYGNTLVLTNISGSPLAAGNSFQVFNAPSRSGSFLTITPPTPGTGLAWDLSHLGSGQINVITASTKPVIGNTRLSGGGLIFSGTGGSAGNTYYVLATTNLAAPLTNWSVISTNQYDTSGNFNVTNPYSTAVPQRFYILKQ